MMQKPDPASPPEALPKFSSYPNHGAVRIEGPEAGLFLNDILTANCQTLPVGEMRAGCLLSPQGRILFDMLICRLAGERFWLVTETGQIAELAAKLRLYRLRRQLEIEPLADFQAARLFGTDHLPETLSGELVFADRRRPELGWLWLAVQASPLAPPAGFELVGEAFWQAVRIAAAVPQGAADLTPARALMLEAGLDQLGALDFDKGCYIGQEVTARTRWRGLVKRRIVPVTLSQPLAAGTDIACDDQPAGQLLSSAVLDGRIIALASLRLAALARADQGQASLIAGDQRLDLAIPDWMRPLPEPE